MSDPFSPSGPFEGPHPDDKRTAKIDFGRPEARLPDTPPSTPQGGSEQPGPVPMGWGPPSPQEGWTPLPDGSWSPPPRHETTSIAPPPPEAGPPPLDPSPDATPRRRHRFARIAASALLLGGAVLLGVAISHEFWPAHNATTPQTRPAGGSGPGSFPFGNGGGSGSSGSGGLPFGNGGGSSSGGTSSSAPGAPRNVTSIASAVDPALVDINLTLGDQSEPVQGSATGIVLTSSGLVLTNNHVIDGATTISATDLGNGRTYSATVVGYDRSQDVALIQLDGASGLKTAQLGDSAKATVGQAVVAIGNAGGVGGTPSAAGGSIVALRQQITARDAGDGTSEQLSGLIQTNAAIQPGDSGGPLVNTAGQVIALDTAASGNYSFSSAASQGFAVPLNTTLAIVGQIQNHQSSSTVHIGPTAFLGVELQPANQGGLSGGSGSPSSGALVAGVLSGTPAAQAGLAARDTIVSVDGQSVDSPTALTTLLTRYQPGDKVTIGWTDSAGAQHTTTVQLASGPAH